MLLFRPFETRFPYGSGALHLNLATYSNSPARSTKSTRSLSLPLLVNTGFQVLFHSPPGVLFTFPSRYLFAIGHLQYLALGGGPPAFPPDSSCPVVLRIPASSISFRLQDSYPLRCRFPTVFVYEIFRFRRSLPRRSVDPRFGLFPVRSPLLRKSMFLSLPPAT